MASVFEMQFLRTVSSLLIGGTMDLLWLTLDFRTGSVQLQMKSIGKLHMKMMKKGAG